jgi:hypothetical protein
MAERPSAEIIQFPRPQSASAPELHQSPELARARLLLALASLEAALAGQRAAVTKWRGSVSELRGTMAGLGHSMRIYQERLGKLTDRVATLNGDEAPPSTVRPSPPRS